MGQNQIQWDATPDPAKMQQLQQAQPQQAAQPVTSAQPTRKAQPSAPPANVKWDATPDPTKIAALTPTSTPPDTSTQTHRDPNDIVINDNDSLMTKAAKTVGGLFQGIGQSAIGTVVGSDDWMRKHGPAWMTENLLTGKPADLNKMHEYAGTTPGTDHGAAYSPQSIGRTGEDVAEFILGDEALKGSSMSQSLEKALKSVKMLEESPILTRIVQAGIRGLRGGVVGGAQAGLKTGDPDAVEREAAGGAIGSAVLPEVVGGAAKVIKGIIPGSVKGIAAGETAVTPEDIQQFKDTVQEAFHGSLRDAAETTARDAVGNPSDPAQQVRNSWEKVNKVMGSPGGDLQTSLPEGVTPSAAETHMMGKVPAGETAQPFQYQQPESMRDVFGNAARTVLGSAQSDFKTLDTASGGRWQRFNDAIENLSDKMAEVNGVDDEAYSKLEGQRGAIEAQQQKMLDAMKAGGQVDPKIADRAQSLYKQGMALQDLNKAAQTSTKNIVVQTPDGKVVTKEVTDSKLLGPRVLKLNDVPVSGGPSRLEQALGSKENAQAFVDNTDSVNRLMQTPDFKPTFSTGKKALDELVNQNTVASPHIANPNAKTTNWTSVVKQIDAMGPEQQQNVFGKDLPKVKQYVQSKAALQRITPYLVKVAGGGAAAEIGWHTISSILNHNDSQ